VVQHSVVVEGRSEAEVRKEGMVGKVMKAMNMPPAGKKEKRRAENWA